MTQELIFKETNISAYDEFRSQLTALQAGNEKAVFDYRDPKGNKEARSHVYKLRQTKAAIEKVRKQEKEIYLLKGRQVDSEAKEISAVVEQMIEVHEAPLKEIEREEDERKLKHKEEIDWLYRIIDCSELPSEAISLLLSQAKDFDAGPRFEEFEQEALKAKLNAITALDSAYLIRKKFEEDQAELARLRQEAFDREQKEREDRIAREAAESARIAAEQAAAAEVERAKREKAEAEAAALRQQQESERAAAKAKADADAAAKAAQERAEREKQQAIEQERQRVAAEAAQQSAEAARREKDTANKKRVNNEILADLATAGLDEATAKLVITAMAKGLVRNVKINY
jgi:hypothetical protein